MDVICECICQCMCEMCGRCILDCFCSVIQLICQHYICPCLQVVFCCKFRRHRVAENGQKEDPDSVTPFKQALMYKFTKKINDDFLEKLGADYVCAICQCGLQENVAEEENLPTDNADKNWGGVQANEANFQVAPSNVDNNPVSQENIANGADLQNAPNNGYNYPVLQENVTIEANLQVAPNNENNQGGLQVNVANESNLQVCDSQNKLLAKVNIVDEENLKNDTNKKNQMETCIASPCNHYFHRECFRNWIKQKENCPTCRKDLKKYQFSKKDKKIKPNQK